MNLMHLILAALATSQAADGQAAVARATAVSSSARTSVTTASYTASSYISWGRPRVCIRIHGVPGAAAPRARPGSS